MVSVYVTWYTWDLGSMPASTDWAASTTREDFRDWLPAFSVRTVVGRRFGQWYAVATDFRLAGMGASEQEAKEDLSGLLEAYLRSFYVQGRPFVETVRPMSARTKLRLMLPLRHKKRQLLFPLH
jgi:hypothetical protein